MPAGPHETRLAQAVVPMRSARVEASSTEWRDTADRLEYVRHALRKAAAAMQAHNSGAMAERA